MRYWVIKLSPPFNRKEKRPLRSTNEILLHSKFLFLEMSSSENYSVHIFSENDYLHCNIRSLLPTIIHEALKIDTSGQLRNLGIIREYSILISIFAYLFIFSNFITLKYQFYFNAILPHLCCPCFILFFTEQFIVL